MTHPRARPENFCEEPISSNNGPFNEFCTVKPQADCCD